MIIKSMDDKFELAAPTDVCRVAFELTGFKRLAELGKRPLLEDVGEKSFFTRCLDLLTDYFAVRRECLIPAAQTAVKIIAQAYDGPGLFVDAVFDERFHLSVTLAKEKVASLSEKIEMIGGIEKANLWMVDLCLPREIFERGSVIYYQQTLKSIPLYEQSMPASELFETTNVGGIPCISLPGKARHVIQQDHNFRERLGLK